MAILNFLSLEPGATTEANATSQSGGSAVSIQSGYRATGDYALMITKSAGGVCYGQEATYGATGAAAAFNNGTLWHKLDFLYVTKPASGDEEVLNFSSQAATNKLTLRLNSAGNLVAYDSAGTLLATGATVLTAKTWYRIEAKVASGASAAWEVKINGTSEISGSTANTLVSTHALIYHGCRISFNTQPYQVVYDNIATDDAAYPGACGVIMLHPTGDGAAALWTIGAGSGSNYQQVDELSPNSDTDYLVSTAVSGDANLVALSDFAASGGGGAILAVKIMASVKRDGGTNGSIKLRAVSGATTSDATAFASTSAYSTIARVFATDPNTGAAWTSAAVDALQFGLVENSAANKTRVSWLATFVLCASPTAAPTVPLGRVAG